MNWNRTSFSTLLVDKRFRPQKATACHTPLIKRNNASICLKLSGRIVGVVLPYTFNSSLPLFAPCNFHQPASAALVGDFDTVFHFSLPCERAEEANQSLLPRLRWHGTYFLIIKYTLSGPTRRCQRCSCGSAPSNDYFVSATDKCRQSKSKLVMKDEGRRTLLRNSVLGMMVSTTTQCGRKFKHKRCTVNVTESFGLCIHVHRLSMRSGRCSGTLTVHFNAQKVRCNTATGKMHIFIFEILIRVSLFHPPEFIVAIPIRVSRKWK